MNMIICCVVLLIQASDSLKVIAQDIVREVLSESSGVEGEKSSLLVVSERGSAVENRYRVGSDSCSTA